MMLKILNRWIQSHPRILAKFAINFGWKGILAVRRFQKRRQSGEIFPAFLFISVTNNCNLRCQGCWVTPSDPIQELDAVTIDRLIHQGKKLGCHFFGILGGEPLMHRELFNLFQNHQDCYFLLFTNGTMLTQDRVQTLFQIGNVSPLISIEGDEIVSDIRRGGNGVYLRSMEGLRRCLEYRLITGVATSVCKSNIEDLATESFIERIANLGVQYLWFYIYRPVGPDPAPELALSSDEIASLRRFIVDARLRAPLLIIDSYWDHDGHALCPAAVGISHHIGPNGDIEACPPIQFAAERIGKTDCLYDLITQSAFLKKFREVACQTTRGCILMERPDVLYQTLQMLDAKDTSGRNSAFEELAAMTPFPSHTMPGNEIPEKSWMYRFAKKHWFFGFGAYG